MQSATVHPQTRSASTITPSQRLGNKVRHYTRRASLYALLIILGFLFALPFLWMISSSLKNTPQTFTVPPIWIPIPMRFQNFPEALTFLPFGLYTLNTLRIAIPATLGTVISCAIVAYGFSRIRWG